jgi:crotonobetainyl-CoA:carnitine CoA-transferase CaiB-like acyl-CoA transferase
MLQAGHLIQRPDGPPSPLPRPPVESEAVAWDDTAVSRLAAVTPPTNPDPGRGALDGLKVVDLTIYIAGPSCGRTLAEFGADVIKVDPPGLGVTEQFWRDTSRGKRSLALDLKHPKGREILLKLLDSADVIVENFRKGVADRLGLSYKVVSARNPRLIYASLNCYGHSGPFADRPGWEQLGQAVSGMQVRAGGREGVPTLARYAVNDYGTGLSLALGVLAAVHERERTGRGQHISAALANVAGFLQSVYMFDFPGYERHEIEGQDAVGTSALSRMYECADSWLFLHCSASKSGDLAAALELPDIASDLWSDPGPGPQSLLAERIANRLRANPTAFWLKKLGDHHIAAVRVASMEDLQVDPAVRKAGLIEVVDQGAETIEHVGIPHRLSMTPATSRWEAPALGADTVAILGELGYEDAAISELFEENVVMT